MMNPFEDVERFIINKRREIEEEKKLLSLETNNKGDCPADLLPIENIAQDSQKCEKAIATDEDGDKPDSPVPIGRYGQPSIMLKTGVYSPNNPLVHYTRPDMSCGKGDAFVGLGAYEELNRIMRRARQKEYRECLEEQTKQKRLQNTKEIESRQRSYRLRSHTTKPYHEEVKNSPKMKSQSVQFDSNVRTDREVQCAADVEQHRQCKEVQCDDTGRTSVAEGSGFKSVAIQTDDDIVPTPPLERNITRAERELSPKNVRKSESEVNKTSIASPDSFFDTEAIKQRNLRAEQEAIAKKLFYQQELKRQIIEQQRIKEERIQREKLLEQAERRRLEQQLAQLDLAQRAEKDDACNKHIVDTAGANYEKIRETLRKDTKPDRRPQKKKQTDNFKFSEKSKLPLYYAYNPDASKTSNLEECLKRNLNPHLGDYEPAFLRKDPTDSIVRKKTEKNSPNFVSFGPKMQCESRYYARPNDLPIPVLRHSPLRNGNIGGVTRVENRSDAMKTVESKWQVPIVQKNIVRSDKNILTQLGSIRRQLQLEQLKLDKLIANDDAS